MTIEILLADDRCLILESIKAVLQHEPEIEVIGTAVDGISAIAQVKNLQPDIVLMDVEMPNMDGIAATRYICQHLPNTKVIVLTSHRDRHYISQALKAGASGYLLKDSLLEDLKQAIYSLGRGYSYIEAKLLTQAIDKIQKTHIVKYQEKVTYFKKYRKSIYNPLNNTADKLLNNPEVREVRIDRASLAVIFEPSGDAKLSSGSSSFDELRTLSLKKLQRARVIKKILWLLLLFLSLIASIIIF